MSRAASCGGQVSIAQESRPACLQSTEAGAAWSQHSRSCCQKHIEQVSDQCTKHNRTQSGAERPQSMHKHLFAMHSTPELSHVKGANTFIVSVILIEQKVSCHASARGGQMASGAARSALIGQARCSWREDCLQMPQNGF